MKGNTLDCGDGDASIFEADGEVCLFDGGADAETLEAKIPGDRVDHLVITHFDEDHYQGLERMLKGDEVEVGCVHGPPAFYQSEDLLNMEGAVNLSLQEVTELEDEIDGSFTDLQRTILENASDYTEITDGVAIGNNEDITVEVLAPRILKDEMEDLSEVLDEIEQAVNDDDRDMIETLLEMGNEHGDRIELSDPSKLANENSAVIRLSDGERSHLLTGDIGRLAESEHLLEYYGEEKLSVSVLHASHHGATVDDSNPMGGTKGNTKEFLETVDPDVAVVSSDLVSEHDHPDPKFLEQCTDKDIKVAWTGVHSDIGPSDIEDAMDGTAMYDPQELLKLRCVHENQRDDAAEELETDSEIEVTDYALDPKLVNDERYDYSLPDLEVELSDQGESLSLRDNVRAGAVASDERCDAIDDLGVGDRVELDEYHLDPALFTEKGYDIKADTVPSGQLGELAGGTDLTEHAKLGALSPDDRTESADELEWPVDVREHSLAEAATTSDGGVKSGLESYFYDSAAELREIPQVGDTTVANLSELGYESIADVVPEVYDREFSESELADCDEVGEETFENIKRVVENRVERLTEIDGIDRETAAALVEEGFGSKEDLEEEFLVDNRPKSAEYDSDRIGEEEIMSIRDYLVFGGENTWESDQFGKSAEEALDKEDSQQEYIR